MTVISLPDFVLTKSLKTSRSTKLYTLKRGEDRFALLIKVYKFSVKGQVFSVEL